MCQGKNKTSNGRNLEQDHSHLGVTVLLMGGQVKTKEKYTIHSIRRGGDPPSPPSQQHIYFTMAQKSVRGRPPAASVVPGTKTRRSHLPPINPSDPGGFFIYQMQNRR